MLNISKYVQHLIWLSFLVAGLLNAQTVLTVSLGDNNHAASYEDRDGSDIVMMQLQLSSNADIDVTDITISPSTGGIRRNELVDTEILIYEDINHNGVLETDVDALIASDNYNGSFIAMVDDPITVTIPDKTILNGTTQDWIIVHSFEGSGNPDGNNLTIDITDISTDVGSVSGTPVNGNTKTIETNAGSRNGSLYVGEGGSNPLGRNVSSSATNEVMLQLVLASSTLEDATITQIDFDTSGTGDISADLTNAKLYLDGDANGILNLEEDTQIGSTVTSFTGGVISFSSLSEVIDAGTYEHWILVYNFNGSASNGETFIVDLTANGDITASGITVSGAPANGNTATVSATGSLTLSLGSNNPSAATISASESEFDMIQLNLAANATENIDISSISFKTTGTGNESTDIDSVVLVLDADGNGIYDVVYDSQIGSTVTALTDNGNITFSSLSETITADDSEDWLLLYYLNGSGEADSTFKVYFDAVSQITATGATSTNSISPIGLPVNGNIMTISDVGTITLALASTNPGAENFNGTATDMTMLAFTITANDVEDVSIDDITVTPETNDLLRREINGTGNPEVYIYEDVDEDGDLNVAVDRFITSDTYNSFLDNEVFAPTAVTISISGETIAANSSVQWLIVNSITGGSVGDYLEVSVANTGISGTGQTSDNDANISGPSLFGGVKTHVSGSTPGSLTLSEGSQNPGYRFISGGTQNETMLQFQLTADAMEDIDITQFKFIMSGAGTENNDVDSVRIFLDGDNNGSLNLLYDTQMGSTVSSMSDNDTLTFSSFNDTISASSAKNYIVVYNYNTTNNAVGETFQAVTGNAYITAMGITSTSAITSTGGPASGGLATITATGTLTVSAGSNNPASANVSNSDNNVSTIQLNIAAGSNEDVTITAISFTMSGTFDDTLDFESDSFRLYDDDNGNGVFDTGEIQLGAEESPNDDNGTVTFTGLSETILTSTNENWIVLTNLNGTASNFENFRVSFANSTHITATGDDTGNPIYPDGVPVQGGLFTVGAVGSLSLTEGTFNPATGTENPGAQNVEMLQVRLSASGVEDIEVTSITFTADGTGNDLTDLNDTGNGVSLYRDVNNDGQLDGGDTQIDIQRLYSGNNGTVTFTTSADTIDAGTSENWLVVYDYDVAVTNGTTFRVGIYNASQITAIGVSSGLPITETGFPVVGPYKTVDAVGSLSLFTGDSNPGVSDIDEQYYYEMHQFKLETSTIEGIQVNSITITHQGTGNPAGTILPDGVQLVRDTDNDGEYDGGETILATTNFSGSTATFTLSSVTIPADSTENWLVMYNWSPPLTEGETYQTRIANLTDISSTGATTSESITADGSVPTSGGTKTANDDYSLPVELVSFAAEGDYGLIELSWETASEINNMGFELERKLVEDDNFEMIASYRTSPELEGQGSVSNSTEYIYSDSTVIPETEYMYRLIQYDYNGAFEIQSITPSAVAKMPLPLKCELAQNYPNPFNGVTTIKFALPKEAEISLTIYNTLGQKVKTLISNSRFDAGYHTMRWNAKNDNQTSIASGLYFYVLTSNQTRIVKRLVYTK